METRTRTVYQLGEFRFSPRDHRLSLDAEQIHLRPKTFQVLEYLVERCGRLVTRQELLDAVWSGVHVEENVLGRSIWEIREALKRDGDASPSIQTVPKIGYEFVGPVRVIDEEATGPEHVTVPPRRKRTRTLLPIFGLALLFCGLGFAWWVMHRGEQGSIRPPVPLTTDPGLENWPTFSPDGTRIAFQGEAAGDPPDIFVKQLGGDAVRPRTSGAGFDHAAAWSPDGRWIAFLRGEGRLGGPLRVMVIPAVAGDEREVTRIDGPVSWGFRPAWTPDSRALIVPDRDDPARPYSLYRVSLEDGRRIRWTSPDDGSIGEGDKDPVVSPDGTRLAFSRNGDLCVLPLDGTSPPTGRPRRVTAIEALTGAWGAGGPWGLAWTADSREIVFSAGGWPRARLFRVAAGGGPVRPLTVPGPGAFAPAISRAGSRLAYVEWIAGADIWQVELDHGYRVASKPDRLIASSRVDFHPVHSPDGQTVAFHSNRTGTWGLWTASVTGQDARLLRAYDEVGDPWAREAGFSWSPDGRSIVFADGDLQMVDVQSGTCRALPTGLSSHESPLWPPGGQWIYFNSRAGGVWQVYRTPASGGSLEPFTAKGERLLAASPRGLRLYVVRDDTLWMIPSGGGEALQVLDVAPRHVVATERGFLYSLVAPASVIRYFDLDTRRSTLVAEPDRWTAGFSVSPDGRRLAYGLFGPARADLMLVEGFR